MERLTGRFKDGQAFIVPSVVSQITGRKMVIAKLADYEDAEERSLLIKEELINRIGACLGELNYSINEQFYKQTLRMMLEYITQEEMKGEDSL
jgi:hypothetical protein